VKQFVLITRSWRDCQDLDALLASHDIHTRPFPVLRVEEHTDRKGWRAVTKLLASQPEPEPWLLLTSPRAPRYVVEQVRERGVQALLEMKIASVGPATTEAADKAGLTVDLEGAGSASRLAEALVEQWSTPTASVLAGGVHLRPELPRALERAGHRVLKLRVYAMRATPSRELPPIGPSHAVVLTSPRAAEHYLEAVGGLPLPVPHWALGPTTRNAASALGITCSIPDEPTMASLASSLKTQLL
jgi:uroporphyrinogen-III synthase